MTMDTTKLIQRLAEDARPLQHLRQPWTRALVWLALAIPYVALVVIVVSPRGDLMEKVFEWRFAIEQGAALATGVAAAIAAFAATIPGYSRRFMLLPIFPLAIWLGSLGQGCVSDWIQFNRGILSLKPDLFCFPAIVLVGALPAAVMAVMLRRGAPLMPHITAALGGLAAAGIGNFGLRLFHPQDASLMVLVWQFGTVFALTVIAGWGGRYILNWRSITTATHGYVTSLSSRLP